MVYGLQISLFFFLSFSFSFENVCIIRNCLSNGPLLAGAWSFSKLSTSILNSLPVGNKG